MSATSRNSKLVLSYLANNTPKTIKEMAEALSLSENEVKNSVSSLVKDGSVVKMGNRPIRYGANSLIPPQHVSYGDIAKDIEETMDKEKRRENQPIQRTVYEEDILVYVFEHGPLTINEIAKAFSISETTARRKVELLEKEGVAVLSKSKSGPSRVYVAHGISAPKYAFDEQGNPNYPSDVLSDPSSAWEHFKDSGKMQAWLDKKKEERSEKRKTRTNPRKAHNTIPLTRMDAEFVELVYHGHDVKPCFNVKDVANAFISVIDSISSLKHDSISMLGIFAAWGRGKSYLFDIVKKRISNRSKDAVQYDVIEFNAWKYQSVPAIWASLFETIYHHKSWWFRLRFMIRQNAWPVLRDLLLFISVPFVIKLLTFVPTLAEWADRYKHLPLWSLIISLAAYSVKLFSKEKKGIQEIIRKFFKGVSFVEHLGVQAEIEKNLAEYLERWIHDNETKSKKVILYVEDVDRCDSRKMLDIIESLRTVLEQPEIRKRLVVVLSIDAEKLWKAIELKYKDLYDGEKLRETIVNHFDKLFTTSITLSELTRDEEIEFLKALEQLPEATFLERSINQAIQSMETVSPEDPVRIRTAQFEKVKDSRGEGISQTTLSSKMRDGVSPDDHRDVIRLISSSVQSLGQLHLTPRQLSCTYFRSLLAVNLIASSSEIQQIDSSLTDQIIVRSYLHNREDLIKETPYESALNMVIPYHNLG